MLPRFWLFIRMMMRLGILTYSVEGAEKLGRPGQMIIATHRWWMWCS